MRRILSLCLILIFFISNTSVLTSCFSYNTGGRDNGESNTKIILPEYKDYGRGTVDFSKIKYARPDMEKIISDFNRAGEIIEQNKIPYEEQLKVIIALEGGYSSILTMYAYANVLVSKDSSDTVWNEEYEYISTSYPAFTKAVETLFVKAANSPHAEKFQNDYFGDDLIEKYRNGGIYTDTIVALMEREAELESRYSSLSTSSVTITYKGMTDTVDNILNYYKNSFGEASLKYSSAKKACFELYESELERLASDIFVDLFRVRRLISDELGYESYADFAYSNIYHDYSPETFLDFANDISTYALPVYVKLSNLIFNQHDISNQTKINTPELINNTYKMLKEADDELYDAYSYMLQHSLFDIEPSSANRFDGAFTAYFDDYNAPFIFISSSQSLTDYTTLCHEFGHFLDSYLNYSSSTSLDLSEVSSQAFELLALTRFDGIISSSDTSDLFVSEMEDTLTCLIFQGFYAMFEHIAYEIPYNEINKDSLDNAVTLAAERMGLNSDLLNEISYVMIPHIFLYPFYVQSYCTSAAVALEVYFTEVDSPGNGFALYKNLIKREDDNLNFEEHVVSAGLDSPFDDDYLKNIADRIHFELLGSHYFKTHNSGDNAA